MKTRRILSGLLFGFGCCMTFWGLLALILPGIPLQPLRLLLASFSTPADNAAVSPFNRAMRFSLEHSGRVVALGVLIAAAGGALLWYFSPASKAVPASAPVPESPPPPEPIPEKTAETPNPFAVATYQNHQPVQQRSNRQYVRPVQPSPVVHPGPILEKNPIEEPPLPAEAVPVYEYLPYTPPRLTQEARATEAEAGAPSQSGSRLLIRSTAEAAASPAPAVPEPVDAPAAPAEPASASMAAPVPIPPFSPRIRSTMGRHTNSKLPASRS